MIQKSYQKTFKLFGGNSSKTKSNDVWETLEWNSISTETGWNHPGHPESMNDKHPQPESIYLKSHLKYTPEN